jgi:alpha-1,3-rhamnosyltransferase
MSTPLISIFTPVYNHEEYLDDYFRSIIKQTYKNIELILIDDASTDNSLMVIEKWLPKLEERFENLTFISRKENKGLIFNCNESIALANGKYFTGFASDDVMLESNIEEKVTFLERNTEKAMVCSDVYYGNNLSSKKYTINNPKTFENNIFQKLINNGNMIFAPSVVLRKKVLEEIGGYNNKYTFEDYPTWLEITYRYKIGYIRKPLVFYRLSPYSLSRDVEKYKIMIDSHMQILLDMESKYKVDISRGINSLYTKASIFFFLNEMKYYREYREKVNKINIKMFIIDVLIKFKVTPKLYSLTIETIMNFKNKIKQLVYKNI